MTTEAQKTFSVESPEAKLLKELIASQTTDSTLVSSKKIAELEEIVRIQASTLDKVVFETEFVNMPKNFGVVEKTILDVITAYLWPYYTPSASTLSQPPPPPPPHHHYLMETSFKSTVELTFVQTIPALNMKIVTPRETLVFKNIRIVYPLDLFFPLTAVKNNAVLGVSQVTSGSVLASGSAVSKKCRINANTHSLIQFNGKTIALPEKVINGHSLMVAHDASTYRRFMVVVTPITSQNLLKTHILLKQNEIEIIPSGSSPIVTVNSKKIELPVGRELNLLGVDSDNWAGARWDDLNLVLLQQDVGLQQALGSDWGNQDHEPAVGGSVMSNHEGVSVGNLLWEGDGLAVELDEGVGVGVDPAHLGDSRARGKDGAGGDLGDTEDSVVLDSGQWEEEVEWVDNADVLEDEGLPWGDDLHVQGWDGLAEGQLNSGPRGSLHKVWWSVWWWLGKSAGRWSVVWPQVGSDDIKDGLLNNAEVLWHVDELSLEDNLVQGGGLDADNLLQLSNLLGGNKGGVSGLGGNQLLQQLGFWGLNGEGLLGLSGHGVASDNALGLLAGDMGDNDVVLEVEVDEGVAELLNVPHWEDWDVDVALHGNLLNLGLWDLGLKEDVPLLVDGLGGELVLGTKSSSQGEGEGPWSGRLEDEVGGEGEASDGSLRDLGGLKLRHDHLQVVLATLMDLGLDAVGDNLQWAQGLDDLHDGWVGPDLLDLLVGETRDWGLLQGVVLDASLALNLGGSSDLDLQTKSLGGSPGWLQEGGHLVVANRWDKVLRKSWGSPAEDQHVDWVLVDVQVLNN